jgi:2-haloacid dehalogenase
MSSTVRPAAVVFDVFGTLVDWRGGVTAALRAFGERHGAVADWAAFADDWRGAYAPSMDRVRRGELARRNLDALQRVSLDTLLERYGIANVTPAERERLVRAWHALPAWPDAAAGLRRLRERCIVATLSNGHLALQVALTRAAGLAFDTLFSADLFRHYKPDPQTYRGACELLDLPPERVMLAAAHPSDLRAAQACDLRTAFIARPLEFGPHAPAPPDPAEFDVHADSVTSLAEQLAG